MGRSSVSEDIKWQVIGMYKTGSSYRTIASKLHVSKTCVENTVRRFNLAGTVIDAPRSGRPRKTTPRQDRKLLVMSKKDRNASAPDLLSSMKQDDDRYN
ncbi:hypothetical protein J6590_104055, partial [Homalodisca vitripennis]